MAENFPEIPGLLFQALDGAANVNNQLSQHNQEMERLRSQLEDNHNTTIMTIIISATLIGLAVLL